MALAPASVLEALLFAIVAGIPAEGSALCAAQFAALALIKTVFAAAQLIARPHRVASVTLWQATAALAAAAGTIATGTMAVQRRLDPTAFDCVSAASAVIGFVGVAELVNQAAVVWVERREWLDDGHDVPYYEDTSLEQRHRWHGNPSLGGAGDTPLLSLPTVALIGPNVDATVWRLPPKLIGLASQVLDQTPSDPIAPNRAGL